MAAIWTGDKSWSDRQVSLNINIKKKWCKPQKIKISKCVQCWLFTSLLKSDSVSSKLDEKGLLKNKNIKIDYK